MSEAAQVDAAALFPECSRPLCVVNVSVLYIYASLYVPGFRSRRQLGRRRDVCKASVAASHRRRRSSVFGSVEFQLTSEPVDSISCLATAICRETQQWCSGNEPVLQRGGRGFEPRRRQFNPPIFFPFRCEHGLSPVGFNAALGQMLAIFFFFSFPASPFLFLLIFQNLFKWAFSNACHFFTTTPNWAYDICNWGRILQTSSWCCSSSVLD